MNLPNKITFSRIIITILIITLLIFPMDAMGFNLPKIFVNETIVMDTKYIIAGCLFILASITDFLDGYIAKKNNLETTFGKVLDNLADKILVNSILIILSAYGFIHPIIPVVIIVRDSIANSIRIILGSKGIDLVTTKLSKVKSYLIMIGITLTLFYNLPFELFNLRVSDFILIVAVIISLASLFKYYEFAKEKLK